MKLSASKASKCIALSVAGLSLAVVSAGVAAQASGESNPDAAGSVGPSVEAGTGTSRGMDSGANPDVEAGSGAGADTRTSGPRENSGAENETDSTTSGGNTGSDRDDADFDVLDTNNDGQLDRDELREGGLGREHRSSDMEGVDGVDRDEFYRYQGGQSE